MFHKQTHQRCAKYRDSHSESLFSEECNKPPYRHVVSSSDDVDRMALESSRARLISHLVSDYQEPIPRDFSSYFYGPKRDDTEPPYLVTTHQASVPIPKKQLIIPTYPSITQELRWNPYVETLTIDDYVDSHTDMEEKPKYNCRCENCKSERCPSKVSSSSTLQPCMQITNIAKFRDYGTMTPQQNDVCCGMRTPLPPLPNTSDVSVCPSEMTVKDTRARIHTQNNEYRRTAPIPLIRYKDFVNSSEECRNQREDTSNIHQEAVSDCEEDCKEPTRSWSIKSLLRLNKKKNEDERNLCRYKIQSDDLGRKVLYNEGISDHVTRHNKLPTRVPSPINVRTPPSVKNRCSFDTDCTIPFSHRGESKYHLNCGKTFSRHLLQRQGQDAKLDEMRHVVDSPHIVSKTYCYKPGKSCRPPVISQPKKMLTSERNIELYIEKRRPKGYNPQICKRK